MPTMPQELFAKKAVVTGSSRGIGRAIALELAAAGANVLIHARQDRDAVQAVAAEILELGGDKPQRPEVILADLADPARQDDLVEQAWRRLGRVDIWINNAGADILSGEAVVEPFESRLERLWRVDVAAAIRLSRLAGARMKTQTDGGAIINIGWDGAERGMAGDGGELFAAAKGAVAAFSRSLAKSLAPKVRVNCLAPGWIKTAWLRDAAPAWQERARRECLLDRCGMPEDVARAARFLAGPSASFITGQTLAVNGGFKSS